MYRAKPNNLELLHAQLLVKTLIAQTRNSVSLRSQLAADLRRPRAETSYPSGKRRRRSRCEFPESLVPNDTARKTSDASDRRRTDDDKNVGIKLILHPSVLRLNRQPSLAALFMSIRHERRSARDKREERDSRDVTCPAVTLHVFIARDRLSAFVLLIMTACDAREDVEHGSPSLHR